PEGAKAVGDWSIAIRNNGAKQWAYGGKPLYASIRDTQPEAMLGEGSGSAWYTAFYPISAPSEAAVRGTALGRVLTDAKGMTLYFAPTDGLWSFDEMKKHQCDDGCMDAHWKMVTLAADEPQPTGNWNAMAQEDGTKALTYKGYPVYTFNGDAKAGDVLRGEH